MVIDNYAEFQIIHADILHSSRLDALFHSPNVSYAEWFTPESTVWKGERYGEDWLYSGNTGQNTQNASGDEEQHLQQKFILLVYFW